MSRHTQDAIEAIIVETLAAIAPDARAAGPSTPLLGDGAAVDSVGFINLLVALEGRLGGAVDLSTSFMDRGDSAVDNPFLTVDSLARHVVELEATAP